MFARNDVVVAAVSGGADSMAMLHYLQHHPARLCVVVAHVNHMLRGQESARDQAFVEQYCRTHGMRCYVKQIDIGALYKKTGQGCEEYARACRYAFFEQINREQFGGRAKIATAHTLSDSAETVLFRLARGTGLRGLCGISQCRGNIVRPLADWTRQQVEDYCVQHNIAYLTDSTNLTDDYNRNRIRHHVLPQFLEMNPGFYKSFARTLDALGQDQAYLQAQATKALQTATLPGGGYAATLLSQLPKPILTRVAAAVLEQSGIAVTHEGITQLCDCICGKTKRVNLSGNLYAQFADDIVSLARQQTTEHATYLPKQAVIGRNMLSNGRCIELALEHTKNFQFDYNLPFFNTADYGKIEGSLRFCARLPSDRIRLARRGCSKTLKKLFNEAHLAPLERLSVAILRDDRGIVWVEGFGIDQRVAPDDTTCQILSICRN